MFSGALLKRASAMLLMGLMGYGGVNRRLRVCTNPLLTLSHRKSKENENNGFTVVPMFCAWGCCFFFLALGVIQHVNSGYKKVTTFPPSESEQSAVQDVRLQWAPFWGGPGTAADVSHSFLGCADTQPQSTLFRGRKFLQAISQ